MNTQSPNLLPETPPTVSRSFSTALLAQGSLALGLFILAALLPPLPLFNDPRPYLPLHITLEFLSIAAALMIFTVGWFSFSHERGARFQILACAFLAVALLDFVHTLSYLGMPDLITPNSIEKAINFWLPARMISALALLMVALLSPETSLSWPIRWLALAATLTLISVIIMLGLFFPDTAPRTFIAGEGLTPFKIGVEYAVSMVCGIAMALLIREWQREHDRFRALLITGLWILLLGELALTFYATVTDLHNLLGHIFKTWGDGFVFWAVYTRALDEPYRRLLQSEQLLTRNQEQARILLRENQLLLDSAFVGIFLVKDRRILRANHLAETLFGYAPGELNGVPTEALYPDRAAFLALGESAYPLLNRGEIFARDMEIVRKDGSRFWCLLRGQALTPGQPAEGSIWIMEDVSERRRARQALQDAADLYRAIFESRDVIKILVDPDDGRIVDANRAAAEFYGESRDNLRQRYAWELSAMSCKQLMAWFTDLKAGQIDLTSEYQTRHRRVNGELCEVGIHLDLIHRENRRLLLATVLDITARKAAESALQHSELRFRTLFSAAKVTMLLIDPGTGDIVDANTAAGDYYGYPVDQLCRMKISAINVLTPDQIAEEMRQAAQEKRSHFHFRHRLANSEVRDVEVHSGPLELDGRSLLYSIIHDVTDRRRLQTERHKLSQAVEQSPASIVITDPEGRIEYVNRQFLQTTGYALEEVLGQNPRVLKSGETPPEEYTALWNAIRHGQTWRGLFHNRKKNGELYWELAQISPICDEQGRITHYLGVKENVTAQKAIEDALRDSEQRLQQVLEGANDGFWDWNVVTGEALFSPRWAEMLGYDLIEIDPHIRTWETLVHPDDMRQCQTALQAHFAGEAPRYQCEYRMLAKNGEWRWILDRGKVTARDTDGQPLRMAGTHTDVTERRSMEETLRASLVEVQRHDARMIGLNRMNDLLLSCETREEAYAVIARSAGRLLTWCSGGLAMLGGEQDDPLEFQVVATWGDSNALPATFPPGQCWALQRGELHQVTDSAQSAQCQHFADQPPSTYLCIPLTVRGETHGLLHVSIGAAQTKEQFQELRTLAIAISEAAKLALSNLKLREALREQAIRDPLTGLFNRRYLDETLRRELHRCQRQGEPLAAAMLDIDHFKRFNDNYGHEAGDNVLRAIGGLLKRSLRTGDIACRYGGEELTMIMPGSPLADAQTRLDSLRQAIMAMQVLYQGEDLPAITVSIGVAAAGEQEVDAAALLGRADAALYLAKEQGRNRVITD